MSNSPLISGTLLTNNCYTPRAYKITRITPHYMSWYTDAKTCCESFVPASRRASANYCIGKDGEIWLNVEEKNAAWTSGSYENDNRAITIECANYMDNANGHVIGQLPQRTWNSLVKLCVDICARNNIEICTYTGDTNGVLTKHKWFQNTDCPGPWLDYQFKRLSNEVNYILLEKELVNMTFLFTCDGTYKGHVYFYDGGTVRLMRTANEKAAVSAAYKGCTGTDIPFFHLKEGSDFIRAIMNTSV